jgi:hypothetical protein
MPKNTYRPIMHESVGVGQSQYRYYSGHSEHKYNINSIGLAWVVRSFMGDPGTRSICIRVYLLVLQHVWPSELSPSIILYPQNK